MSRADESLRRRLYVQLSPSAWAGRGLSPVNRGVVALILLSIAVAVLESEPALRALWTPAFDAAEWVITGLFVAEYAARLWTSAENPRFGPGLRGRLRYAASLPAILDILAIAPLFLTAVGSEAFLFRLLRLLRILRLAKLARYSSAMAAIGEAISSRRYELIASVVVALILLLLSSTCLYIAESDAQPETFGSIPRAMWWSVATLTTVGYGDVVPVTVAGRLLAGVTAVIGIGLIAMPTGILAAAFSDAVVRRRGDEDGA